MLVDFKVESNKCLNSTAIILLSGFVYIYRLGLVVTLTDMEFAVLAVPVINWRRCGNNQRDLYFWNIIKKLNELTNHLRAVADAVRPIRTQQRLLNN